MGAAGNADGAEAGAAFGRKRLPSPKTSLSVELPLPIPPKADDKAPELVEEEETDALGEALPLICMRASLEYRLLSSSSFEVDATGAMVLGVVSGAVHGEPTETEASGDQDRFDDALIGVQMLASGSAETGTDGKE